MGCQENQIMKTGAGCGSILALDSPTESSAATGSFKLIPLTQGKFAIVDAEDFEWLSQWKWYACLKHGNWYAYTKHSKLCMQRLILGLTAGDGKKSDHINHRTLDNRRRNIRICTNTENQQNRNISKNNTSGFKGVYWGKDREKWITRIQFNKKKIWLGYFSNKIEAAKCYDKAAKKLFGEFARCNFA